PIKRGVKFLRCDLPDHQRDEQRQENRDTDQISPIKSHRDGIATGLTQSRGGDLDDPENQRDLRHLAESHVRWIFHLNDPRRLRALTSPARRRQRTLAGKFRTDYVGISAPALNVGNARWAKPTVT